MNKNIIEGTNGDFFVEDLKPGGFKKIKDYTKKVCLNPSHNPPSHMYLEPGLYEYTCPSCGHTVTLNIPLITC